NSNRPRAASPSGRAARMAPTRARKSAISPLGEGSGAGLSPDFGVGFRVGVFSLTTPPLPFEYGTRPDPLQVRPGPLVRDGDLRHKAAVVSSAGPLQPCRYPQEALPGPV